MDKPFVQLTFFILCIYITANNHDVSSQCHYPDEEYLCLKSGEHQNIACFLKCGTLKMNDEWE